MIFSKYEKRFGTLEVQVDEIDRCFLDNFAWGFYSTPRHNGVYVVFQNSIKNGAYRNKKLHRVIAGAKLGQFVDHINGNPLDNRRSNLRICTQAENNRNAIKRKTAKTSEFKGVSFYKPTKKWFAQLQIEGKKINGGYHATEKEAAQAYNRLALEHFREYAVINKFKE